MVYVFRTLLAVFVLGLMMQLCLAQRSMDEIPDDAKDRLKDQGDEERHQGPDNPRQGNRSGRDSPLGGDVDPYGPESFDEFTKKNKRHLYDPQWQLKIDMADPRRIVIDYPDGTSEVYWYVVYRVINDNVRVVREPVEFKLNRPTSSLSSPAKPVEAEGGYPGDVTDLEYDESDWRRSTNVNFEGLPVETTIDFVIDTFTRDVEKDPWDTEWGADPDIADLGQKAIDARKNTIKKTYRSVSDPFIMQKIAQKEGLWEWVSRNGYSNSEPINILQPQSAFQRQIGYAHNLNAPLLTGPRALAYRGIRISDSGERSEFTRYVGVYDDKTFAGMFGDGDTLPDGVSLVKEGDEMWGKLTQRRYQVGDCIDRFGNILQPNDPGYIAARAAGGDPDNSTGYGVVDDSHPAKDTAGKQPHFRLYQDGDKVLYDYDTGIRIPGAPNDTYRINGKVLSKGDPLWENAAEVNGDHVGQPVKRLDHRGRAIRKYLVTYQAGDVVTQAEWDIYKRRLGPGILSRYTDPDSIVGRPLGFDDPLVGMPKIKMGTFTGDSENGKAEIIKRGVATGETGEEVEMMEPVDYTTGRPYDPKKIGSKDFQRDPDGEFTTNRTPPIPDHLAGDLNDGEEYVYAPLGDAAEGAVPVPSFDRHDVWADYRDPISGVRIPLKDAEGELVRDDLDQILYLKEYEYEYVYLYEFEPLEIEDSEYEGAYTPDRRELITQDVRMKYKDGKNYGPLLRLRYVMRDVNEPRTYFKVTVDGEEKWMTKEEYESATGNELGGGDFSETQIRNVTSQQRHVTGAYVDGMALADGEKNEDWDEAEARAQEQGFEVKQEQEIKYIVQVQDQMLESGDTSQANPVEDSDWKTESKTSNDIEGTKQTYRKWTVPPPLVYRGQDADGNERWEVLTRFSEAVGPATRYDGSDAPRFITRYISEMWGVAIFKDVDRNWDYMNVYVRGLRGHVTNRGLTTDADVTNLPSHVDKDAGTINKTFFNPKYVTDDWVYRVRFERPGDGFQTFRDLIRRVRVFWYQENGDDTDVRSRGD